MYAIRSETLCTVPKDIEVINEVINELKPYSPTVPVAVAMVTSVNTIVAWSIDVMSSMINCACGSLQERELFTQQSVDRPHLKT